MNPAKWALAVALLAGCKGEELVVGQLAPIEFHTGPSRALGSAATSLLVADLDGDGSLDLALTDDAGSALDVLAGHGDGTFAAPAAYPTMAGPLGIAAGDWNGDGLVDLACAESRSYGVALFYATAPGTFGPRIDQGDGNGPEWAFAGDFDDDGKLDLGEFDSHGFGYEFGAGDGTFSGGVDEVVANYECTPGVVADFNGDGHSDLAQLSQVSGNLFVQLSGERNPSPGQQRTFTSPQVALPQGGGTLAAADLDGDGHLDLVATDHQQAGAVTTLIGHGDGTFAAPARYPVPEYPTALAVADFNLDGRTDVAVIHPSLAEVSVLAARGDGSLEVETTFSAGGAPVAIGSGDFDGDGRADLVVALDDGTLQIFLNGPGALPAPVDGAGAGDLAVAVDGGAPPGCATGADCLAGQVCYLPCCDTPFHPCYLRPDGGCPPNDELFSCNGYLEGCNWVDSSSPAAPACAPPLAGRCIDLAPGCSGPICTCLPGADQVPFSGNSCPWTGGTCDPNTRTLSCNCQHAS